MILVAVGEFPPPLLERLSRRTRLPLGPARVDPAVAFDTARAQCDSTRLLAELKARYEGEVVGAASLDLYIPVLTYVFGEAEMPGRAALFSIHRLREEFYGLPPDQALLEERALRELWHEVGHLWGLAHCPDAACVMSASYSLAQVDSKSDQFCPACRARLGPARPQGTRPAAGSQPA